MIHVININNKGEQVGDPNIEVIVEILNKLSSDGKVALIERLQDEWGIVAILRESNRVEVRYVFDEDTGEGNYYINAGRTR